MTKAAQMHENGDVLLQSDGRSEEADGVTAKSIDYNTLKAMESQDIEKQKTFVRRSNIDEDTAKYIAENCSEELVESLLDNTKAKITEDTYSVIIYKYSKNEKIKDRLMLRISQEYSSDEQINSLVENLYRMGKLTTTLVVRSICMGYLKFFEYALFHITQRDIIEIRKILSNTKEEFMIRNIMRETGISSNLFPAVITALKIIYELNFDLDKESRENFTQKVIERVLTFDSINEKMDISDIEYLISRIN